MHILSRFLDFLRRRLPGWFTPLRDADDTHHALAEADEATLAQLGLHPGDVPAAFSAWAERERESCDGEVGWRIPL